MAFFPCIYFCENNQLYFTGVHRNLSGLTRKGLSDRIIERGRNRERFYELALKLFTICDLKGLRLVVENPYAKQHFLVGNFPYKAAIIDHNRTQRGDYFNKPTQYWFINCEPSYGLTITGTREKKSVVKTKKGKEAGLCSEERSMISPVYARNFICDFILGRDQIGSQLQLFK